MKPYLIVLGNEKGGSGKSTTALHIVTALLYDGYRVGVLDLDGRQCTLSRYVENRRAFIARTQQDLPIPREYVIKRSEARQLDAAEAEEKQAFETAYADLARDCDIILADCPGSDTFLARIAHVAADTLVTPVNDSFIDLDLLARVDPESYQVLAPSLYAERVWKARQRRMQVDGSSIDWVVLRNRVATVKARNMQKIEATLTALEKRIGMRFVEGLSERVIYRELFLKGLTLLDLPRLGGLDGRGLTLSHVAARQELRGLMSALKLPAIARVRQSA